MAPGGITHLNISIDAQQLLLTISAASMLIPEKARIPVAVY